MYNNNNNNNNNNNDEELMKREPIVLPELGVLYRKKGRLEQYNSNNKLIPVSYTHLTLPTRRTV